MSARNPTNPCSPGLKPTPIATMTFKIHDLRRDVDCLKSTYDVSVDPNKTRIERVLSNMTRKLVKADQVLKFGQTATEYSITEDKTKIVLRRVQKLKDLFRDLLKGQGNTSNPERRSLSEMFHQLLSMEDDLVHFADLSDCGTGRCRSSEEPHWTPAKDCEVQAALLEGMQMDGMANFQNTTNGMKERIVCCTYPEIEESSDYGEAETKGTVFSITNRREEQPQITKSVGPNNDHSVNDSEADSADGFRVGELKT